MVIKLVRNNQRILRSPLGTVSRLLASDEDAFRDLLVTTWIDDEVRNTRTHFRTWAAFEREFRTLVRIISRQYGKPAFLGTCADDEYPEWFAEDCAHLAAWPVGSRSIFVSCNQQDPETPMVLSLGVATPPRLRGRRQR